jgi:threonine/homoserine/homoserine lactone efflux protein
MEWNELLPLLVFALITCGTPGPNNMLLTSAGAAQGFYRTLPLLFGVVGGITLMILATALGLGVVFEQLPLLHHGLKWVGSAYLLWLAYQIAITPGPSDSARPLIPAYQGALLQLLNPKAWMMALSAISGFTTAGDAYWHSASWVLAIFFSMGLSMGACWVLFGASVRHLIATHRGWQCFNLSMGVITAACVVMIWI